MAKRDLSMFADVKVGDVVYTNPTGTSASRLRFTVTAVSAKQFSCGSSRWWKDGSTTVGRFGRVYPDTPELKRLYEEHINNMERKRTEAAKLIEDRNTLIARNKIAIMQVIRQALESDLANWFHVIDTDVAENWKG